MIIPDYETIKKVYSRNPRTIKNKKECYALYEAGLFGNKALTWNSYKEILESGWSEGVCMRAKKKMINRKNVVYDLHLKDVPKKIKEWERHGVKENEISFNQSLPNHKILIQGELTRANEPYDLFLLYSTIKKPTNLALAEEERNASGTLAKTILESCLSPSSYSDMESLLEQFPLSMIEFGSYKIPVGNIPGRNTLIWEVRNY